MTNTTHEKMGRVAELLKRIEKDVEILNKCDKLNIESGWLVKKINRMTAELDELVS